MLASASPRRLALLAQLGVVPAEVVAADLDEGVLPGELPRVHAARLAVEKARAVAGRLGPAAETTAILAGDTVVACGRRILPKAEDAPTARACLEHLSGRRHRVYGAVALLGPGETLRERMVMTQVTMKRLSQAEQDTYLESREWEGKAGGYAIQGLAAAFISQLSGSYSNVVGLPLFETARLLEAAGIAPGRGA